MKDKFKYRIRQIKTRKDSDGHPYTCVEKLHRSSVVKHFSLRPKDIFNYKLMCKNNTINVCKSQGKTIDVKGKKYVYDILYEPSEELEKEVDKLWEMGK